MKTTKKKAIICLAAGHSQKSLIIEAKSLGYYVLAIDVNKNAIGFNFADSFIVESTHEPRKIIKKLEKIVDHFKWVGIINRSSGYPVVTSSILSEYLNIPNIPIRSANTIINKDELKVACSINDIPVGNFNVFSIDSKIETEKFNYPLVIKPGLSLVGKKGISVISNINQFKTGLEYASKHTVNNKIIVEEYLPGPDYTFVSFVENSKIYPICILDELNVEDPDGRIISRGYKTHLPTKDNKIEDEILKLSNLIVDKFKISRSSLMTCFRAGNDNKLKLIEIHLDLGGDLLIEELFPRALNFDFKTFAINVLCGDFNEINREINPCAIFYEKGEALLNQRPFIILEAKTDKELEKIIIDKSL